MFESPRRTGEKALLDRFVSTLDKKGYVPAKTTTAYAVWLFVLDFINKMYDRMTDEDFDELQQLLLNMFSHNTYLLPYLNGGSDFVNIR